jgi:hypothetical protein
MSAYIETICRATLNLIINDGLFMVIADMDVADALI